MKNIKLTIEYDGTGFHGWQKQKGLRTVEGELTKAIELATEEEIKLFGSGRTDKGVHALGQVANFHTSRNFPAENYRLLLEHLLPEDITILKSEEVGLDFHSRYSSKGKKYIYKIFNRYKRSSIHRNYSYHIKEELNLDKMRETANYLIGEKDFTSFKVGRSKVHSGKRKIDFIKIEKEGYIINITFKGQGFMHKMIRIIVGSLIDAGLEKHSPEYILEILKKKDRQEAGKTVDGSGLYLAKVYY